MGEVSDPHAWIASAEEDFILARAALRRKQHLTGGNVLSWRPAGHQASDIIWRFTLECLLGK